MDVGVYFDLRNPPQWQRDPARLYGFTLELCEEAERLGAHSVWLSEHHLFEDGYLTQPLTFAAAVAARTRRVRIGTALYFASDASSYTTGTILPVDGGAQWSMAGTGSDNPT